jgi:predicted ATPase
MGREKELEILWGKLKKAINADGQFVTVVAEAGLGKSRLLYEFRNQLDDEVDIIQGICQSNARNIPYFPFIALLRELLSIGPEDDSQNQVETVVSRILALDPKLEIHIPLFLQLLSITSAKYPLPDHLRSDNIQQAIVEGISAMLKIAANKKPLVIPLEDWHWVDEASQNVLTQLTEVISSFPLCLVVSYRPRFSSGAIRQTIPNPLAPLKSQVQPGW